MIRLHTIVLLAAAMSPALLATSAGGPIAHANVPTDGNGQTCQRCHNAFPLNSPGGSVRIEAFHYRPGQRQTIRVTVSHPEAVKWGFQLTAREAKDSTKKAGTFTLANGIRLRCSDDAAGRDVTDARPCPADALEFAGHNAAIAVGGGANGAKTFDVEWIAPANDVGNITFYAVGNAANNANGNQGDRIYSDRLEVENEAAGCPNNVRPTVTGVGNAAGGNAVSMNTLVSIYGRDFALSGTQRSAGRADLREGFPKQLACAAVEINGQRVPLTYVGPTQINAQVPTLASTGNMQLRVITRSGQTDMMGEAFTINVASYSPAFFTFNSNGKNAAAVLPDGTYATDPAVLPGAPAGTVRAVRGGDIISLFATGLGPTNPVWQAGEIPNRASELRDRLTITIGGTAVPASDILYAGLAPGFISGLYQINVRVPASVANGEVPVTMSIGGVNSPSGTVLNVRNP